MLYLYDKYCVNIYFMQSYIIINVFKIAYFDEKWVFRLLLHESLEPVYCFLWMNIDVLYFVL